jgi:hypothetical protein
MIQIIVLGKTVPKYLEDASQTFPLDLGIAGGKRQNPAAALSRILIFQLYSFFRTSERPAKPDKHRNENEQYLEINPYLFN